MIIARKGEVIEGRDGKPFATLTEDIHSSNLRPRAGHFAMAKGRDRLNGSFLPEEIMEFIRGRLTRGAPDEAKPAPKAKPAAEPKAKRTYKPRKKSNA